MYKVEIDEILCIVVLAVENGELSQIEGFT